MTRCSGQPRRTSVISAAPRSRVPGVLIAVISLVLVGLAAVAGPQAQAAGGLSAHGSARQVYATGLAGGATVTLLDSHGRAVRTQKANSLGGVLFRHVKPGTGYRVRSAGTTSPKLT